MHFNEIGKASGITINKEFNLVSPGKDSGISINKEFNLISIIGILEKFLILETYYFSQLVIILNSK